AALASGEAGEADPWPSVQRLLLTLKEHVSDPAHHAAINAALGAVRPQIKPYPQHDGMVVIASVPVSLPDEQAASLEDAEHEEPEGDEASLAPAGREVLLTEHTQGVEEK